MSREGGGGRGASQLLPDAFPHFCLVSFLPLSFISPNFPSSNSFKEKHRPRLKHGTPKKQNKIRKRGKASPPPPILTPTQTDETKPSLNASIFTQSMPLPIFLLCPLRGGRYPFYFPVYFPLSCLLHFPFSPSAKCHTPFLSRFPPPVFPISFSPQAERVTFPFPMTGCFSPLLPSQFPFFTQVERVPSFFPIPSLPFPPPSPFSRSRRHTASSSPQVRARLHLLLGPRPAAPRAQTPRTGSNPESLSSLPSPRVPTSTGCSLIHASRTALGRPACRVRSAIWVKPRVLPPSLPLSPVPCPPVINARHADAVL